MIREERQSAIGNRQSVDNGALHASGLTPIASYRDLRVWKLSIDLAVDCYRETRQFPQAEIYGLTSQVRRSATSIAEGYGRDSKGAYLQFLRVSQGSLKELETHVIVCRRLELLSAEVESDLLRKTDDVGRMLRALIRSIEQAI